MNEYLEKVFEAEQRRIRLLEWTGIANRHDYSKEEFARICLRFGDNFDLQYSKCVDICANHWQDLLQELLFVPPPTESNGRPFQVNIVQMALESVLLNLRPKFLEAIYLDDFLKRLEGNDPIQTMSEWINHQYDEADFSRQKDLKPVIRLLNEEHSKIVMGIARTASVIGEDGVEYSNFVASACCNPIRIPQKGRRFAVTLLARAGGSEVSFEKAFYENLKMMIKGRSDLLPATSISTAGPRISETKTVLSSLKIAKVEKGKHNKLPVFEQRVKEFINSIL